MTVIQYVLLYYYMYLIFTYFQNIVTEHQGFLPIAACFTVSLVLCAWFLTMGNSIEQHRAAIGSFYSSCRCVFLTARYVIPFTILFPELSFFVNRFVSLLTCVRDNAVLINFYLQFFTFILLLSGDICQLIFCRHSDYIIYVYSINVLRKISYCGLIIIRVSTNLDNG